ncbi:MAG: hypothetical protein FWD61_14895 [Phycisphaerales bacterium]|nr:hypothetical protein [Phycisphaerales bacterium]
MRAIVTGLVVGLFCATGFAEMMANPVYEAWAACKLGTSVTIKMTNKLEDVEDSTTQEEKLVEVTPEQVVIAVTTSEGIVVDGSTQALPSSKVTIPAKVEKELAPLARQFQRSNAKVSGMKESKETVEVKGKKVEATKYEYAVEVRQGDGDTLSAKVKCWMSKEVPGGVVREEVNVERPEKVTGVREVTDYKKEAK